jgi:hypothetical protein
MDLFRSSNRFRTRAKESPGLVHLSERMSNKFVRMQLSGGKQVKHLTNIRANVTDEWPPAHFPAFFAAERSSARVTPTYSRTYGQTFRRRQSTKRFSVMADSHDQLPPQSHFPALVFVRVVEAEQGPLEAKGVRFSNETLTLAALF